MKSLFTILTIFLFITIAQAQYGGGTGEPNDPYLIYTAEQMNAIGTEPNDWDKHFRLMADIDLNIYTGTDFNIIGYTGTDFSMFYRNNAFTGVFDGNGHIISNFSYTSTEKRYIGLFGCVGATGIDAMTATGTGKDAMIKDLELIEPNVDAGTGDDVGTLVGGLSLGTITNCSVKGGTVSGNQRVGGLVGWNSGGEITNCYVTGYVEGVKDVGGLVGINYSIFGKRAEITNCYSVSSITGNESVGGLVGHNESVWTAITWSATISNCYSIGNVFGIEHVGGLVGDNIEGSLIIKCYATGRVSGTTVVGGLVGENRYYPSKITTSFWDIETSGRSNMCGIEVPGGSGCDNANGKTTAEMQTADTFLEAGWDFVDEIENSTEDIWWILEGQSYPRLWWQYGLAFSPYPQNGVVDIPQPLTFSWLPGGSGLYHDIYFGEDKEAVANATIENLNIYRGRQESEMTTYNPGNLELVKTYYWRIDEVSDTDPNNPWKGDVWSFTTANFIIVDDFESYSAENQVWYSWRDGLGYGEPGTALYYASNNTGSAVGDETTGSYMEETIVHSGGKSLPLFYDNNKKGYYKYSETEKTLIYLRGWTEQGIIELSLWFHGRPASVGNFVEGPAGIYTMTGSGTDIGGEHDQFHFAYKMLTGPGSIEARIESIDNTHEWAKAGVMIRWGLHEETKYAFIYVTPSNGIAFQARAEWGQTSVATNQTGITAPLWIKLERSATGNFTASYSVDGTTWQPAQNPVPINISMSSDVNIGLAVTAHDANATCQAVFSNVTISGTVSTQWAHQDIGIASNNPEPMYVAVSNSAGPTAVVAHPDSAATQIDSWTEWVIPLSAFADQGIDLTDVDRIAIGFGIRGNQTIPGGQGKMNFDDIRLYPPRPVESLDLEVNVP